MRRVLFLLILALLGGAAWVVLAPAGPVSEIFVDIPPHTSARQIGVLLEQSGVVRSRYGFDVVWLVRRGRLKAGEYRFDHPAPVREVYDRLLRGDVYTIAVTIPEGSNLFDIGQRLEAQKLGTQAEFVEAAREDVGLVADIDPGAQSLEGYLFPDTYHFQRHATEAQMAAMMVKRFRAEAAAAGLDGDYRRVVTLASVVERETPIPSERPLVASVMVNRLAKGMPLMTDPTVIYAQLLAGTYRGKIYQSDLAYDSPYNTYRHTGLPPGPICNPGLASLRAAMTPAETEYLYFVAETADPSGHSRFSRTLEEHQKNVAAYRQAVRNGGGR